MPSGTEVARLFVSVGADVRALVQGMGEANAAVGDFNNAGQRMYDIGSAAQKMGLKLTAGLTTPIVAAGKKMVETAATFESKMKIIEGLALGTGGNMGQLELAILAVGRATDTYGIDALQAADATIELYRSGQDATTMFGNLQGVIDGTASVGGTLRATFNLMTASELDAEEATKLIIMSMATFGMTASETTGLVDLLVKAANASVMNVDDMAGAFRNAAPTLATFGWSANDVTTSLAILSQHGFTGAQAGNALLRMMMNMQRPTKAVQETLDALGLSFYDSNGAMKDARTILGEVQGALWGSSSAMGVLTEQQRNLFLQTLMGYYGIKGGTALMAGGIVAWDEMTQSISEQAGAAQIAQLNMDTFNGQMQILKKTMMDFMITAGLPFIQDVLTPLLLKMIDLAKSFAAMDPESKSLIINIGLIAAAVGPVLLVLGTLLKAFGNIKLAMAMSAQAATLAADLGVAGGAAVATTGFFATLGTVVAGVAAVFAGFKLGQWLEENVLKISENKALQDWWYNIFEAPNIAALNSTAINAAKGIGKGYASGTPYASGGMALVGERGPEMVQLPGGSRVTRNEDLGKPMVFNITVNASGDGKGIAEATKGGVLSALRAGGLA